MCDDKTKRLVFMEKSQGAVRNFRKDTASLPYLGERVYRGFLRHKINHSTQKIGLPQSLS